MRALIPTISRNCIRRRVSEAVYQRRALSPISNVAIDLRQDQPSAKLVECGTVNANERFPIQLHNKFIPCCIFSYQRSIAVSRESLWN